MCYGLITVPLKITSYHQYSQSTCPFHQTDEFFGHPQKYNCSIISWYMIDTCIEVKFKFGKPYIQNTYIIRLMCQWPYYCSIEYVSFLARNIC